MFRLGGGRVISHNRTGAPRRRSGEGVVSMRVTRNEDDPMKDMIPNSAIPYWVRNAEPTCVTVSQMASKLGVHRNTIYNWIHAGKLEVHQLVPRGKFYISIIPKVIDESP